MSFDKRVWKGALLISILLVLFSANAAAWDPADMQDHMEERFETAFGDASDANVAIQQSDDNAVFQVNGANDIQRTSTSNSAPSWFSTSGGDSISSDSNSDSSPSNSAPVWFSSSPSSDDGSSSSSSGSNSPASTWGHSSGDSSNSGSSDSESGSDSNRQIGGNDQESSDSSNDNQDRSSPAPSGSLEQQAESIVLNNLNQERQQRGLGSLSHDSGLQTTARAKSQDMATRNYFAHTAPDGTGFRDLFNRHSVSCARGGENLARTWMGRTVSTGTGGSVHYDDAQSLADGLTRQWMNSDGHRRAILRGAYNNAGVGIEITSSGQVYATTHFCT